MFIRSFQLRNYRSYNLLRANGVINKTKNRIVHPPIVRTQCTYAAANNYYNLHTSTLQYGRRMRQILVPNDNEMMHEVCVYLFILFVNIYSQTNTQTQLSRNDVMRSLKTLIGHHVIALNSDKGRTRLYWQRRGIAQVLYYYSNITNYHYNTLQGCIVSTMLCNLYLGAMENEMFPQLLQQQHRRAPHTLLMRHVDDALLMTRDRSVAVDVSVVMMNCDIVTINCDTIPSLHVQC